jgi:dihydropteroate synthase
VTGTLAEPALRRVVVEMAEAGLVVDPVVVVLNIQVAALMTTEWVARKLAIPGGVDRVMLPGYCRGDLAPIAAKLGVAVERGPQNVHDLPDVFGQEREAASGYGDYSIEIIAEINDAPRLTLQAIIDEADRLRRDGADVIDVGCDPQADRPAWGGVAEVVRELRGRGHRVSVDSFHPTEVDAAVAAGAELVLSVNSSNREAASGRGAEVVAIPDTPRDLASLDRTIDHLVAHNTPFRVDPVVEPIGFGFAASLGRYLDVRRRYPDIAMMMGVGNLTEMTEVDSAGVNALLIGFCQELNIASVLTTRVINWCRSAVREIDIARRVMHHALKRGTPPKHIDERLVMLRDPMLRPPGEGELAELAAKLTDRNVRLFADAATGRLHAMRKGEHVSGGDPFTLFDQLAIDDPSHAFYLGYELAKAVTAVTLGKNYVQDEPLRWGVLTREETTHYENRKRTAQT